MQYPRRHEPILPQLLRPLVLGRSTAGFSDGRDDDVLAAFALGAAVWTRLSDEMCRRLGRLVVNLVERRLSMLPASARAVPMPAPHAALHLPLEKRTLNTLRRAAHGGADARQWTLGDYLGLRRFGARAVVDLLAAVEAADGHGSRDGLDVAGAAATSVFESTPDEILIAIGRRLPISAKEASAYLVQRSRLAVSFEIERLMEQTARAGRKVPFKVIQIGGTRVIVRLSEVTAARDTYRIASRAIHFRGVAAIVAVAGQVRAMGHSVDLLFVERLLRSFSTFEWLDRRAGWFWFLDRRNPLLAQLRKILSVVTKVALPRLAAALSRVRSAPLPPPQVIQRMCADLPGWRFVDGALAVDHPLDREANLKENEKRIVELIEAAGGELPGGEIRRRVQAAGLSWAPVWKLLRTSPLFEQSDDGLFRLLQSDHVTFGMVP